MTDTAPRTPPRWLNRNVAGMGLASFLSDFGHEMATAALPGFLALLGLGAFSLGAIEGIADGISAFVKLIAGRRSDTIHRRQTVATTGYVLTGLSKALFALAQSWPILLVGRIVGWFGRGIRGPIRDAMLAESVPADARGRAFGLHRAADTIGAVAGPLAALGLLAAGHATDRTYRVLFLWTAVPGVLSAVAFGGLVRDPRPAPGAGKRPRVSWRQVPRAFHRYLWAVGIYGLADFAPTLLILRATDLLAPARGLAVAGTIAVGLYTLRNAVYAASAFPIGFVSDRIGRAGLLAAGYALLAIVAALAAIPGLSLTWLVVIFALHGIVAGTQDTLEGSIAADLLPLPVRGTGYGALAAVNGVGDLLSSLIIGAIWVTVSPTLALALAAGLALIGATLMAGFSRVRITPER